MNRLNLLFLSLLPLALITCISDNKVELSTDNLLIRIDGNGYLTEMKDISSGENYLSADTVSPLISIRVDSAILMPVKVRNGNSSGSLIFDFDDGFEATVRYSEKETHLVFEILEMSGNDEVEMVIWGPYQTTLGETIGETVGVVQGADFSLGLQALNEKTLGGYPWTDNDCMPQINIFAQDDYSDMAETNTKDYVLYRVEAAKPTRYGSSLQAYCRNRFGERIIENLSHEKYVSPPFKDGGVIGSKIAIFGVGKDQALDAISRIEVEEDLPHPMMDGVWTKISPQASSAYIILSFGVDDIDRAIEITNKAGLKYLYHPGPFLNWGHFDLRSNYFPNGIADLKYCVDLAESQGLKVGVHTLSNFTTTNDRYVTPVPDRRLAKVGSSVITNDVDQGQREIEIAAPDFFNQFKNNNLKTVRINDELIRYGNVSQSPPWKLLNCERGAFGTTASAHSANDTISKLIDHAYKVFLTDASLSAEMSKNLADLFNQTGLRQISFDGLEGNRSTGMGNYGEILFAQTWYDNINDDIKSHFIADASRTSHYFWHMYTRMNWGEPWYAGFRESQTEYRLKNQAYFKRNLMPAMLGWFKMTDETSIEDVEWMLARSAAFNAGYSFVVDFASLDKNRNTPTILSLLGDWEEARISGAFTDDQRKAMEDVVNEFHLERTDDDNWELTYLNTPKFKHVKKIRQPGEPVHSVFEFEHTTDDTPFHFNITAANGNVKNIKMEVDNYKLLEIPVELQKGETLKYTGGARATVYDKNWAKVREIDFSTEDLRISTGGHSITFDCEFSQTEEAAVSLELRLVTKTEKVTSDRG